VLACALVNHPTASYPLLNKLAHRSNTYAFTAVFAAVTRTSLTFRTSAPPTQNAAQHAPASAAAAVTAAEAEARVVVESVPRLPPLTPRVVSVVSVVIIPPPP
jgi:hypothetical protein